MRWQEVRWGGAVSGAVIAEVAQVAATFVWVAVYSYVINPGQPVAAYEAHAQRAGPLVSVLAGFPIFYAASRWIAKSVPTSLALFGVFVAMDGALLALMPTPITARLFGAIALSYVTKYVACVLGGRHATARH